VLLGHHRAKSAINNRDDEGKTALWCACYWGHGGVARALLPSGADPTIAARSDGTTPMAIAKQEPHRGDISAEGRRECVAELEVSSLSL
jgi:ankyrin repeat protein